MYALKMRYSNKFDTFKTSTWKRLWDSNIPDLESLKKLFGKSGFIAIDAEPYGTSQSQVTEIGISYIPPSCVYSKHTNGSKKLTIEILRRQYGIQSRCFRVSANQRREKNRERYAFGDAEAITEADIERVLVDAVASFTGSDPKPTLVGFSLGFELKLITTQWPRLVDAFSAWVDVQEVARDVSGGNAPGMRDTLIAFGFGHDYQAVHSHRTTHNAVNDAMRISATLLSLGSMCSSNSTPTLEIGRTIRHKNRLWKAKRNTRHRRIWKTKPASRELYPFIARVSVNKQLNMFSAEGLMEFFSEYSPIAVGINYGQRYGWVCLESLEELRHFVQEVNNKPFGESSRDAWIAVEDYDPSVIPVTSAGEIYARRRAEQEAQADEKRLQRAQKRQANIG